jgi:hypothetical protein
MRVFHFMKYAWLECLCIGGFLFKAVSRPRLSRSMESWRNPWVHMAREPQGIGWPIVFPVVPFSLLIGTNVVPFPIEFQYCTA